MQEDNDAEIIINLMRQAENAPGTSAQFGNGAAANHWVHGNHNIVITGGSVSIHFSANACPLFKGDAHD
jgi:hypothetical protein